MLLVSDFLRPMMERVARCAAMPYSDSPDDADHQTWKHYFVLASCQVVRFGRPARVFRVRRSPRSVRSPSFGLNRMIDTTFLWSLSAFACFCSNALAPLQHIAFQYDAHEHPGAPIAKEGHV